MAEDAGIGWKTYSKRSDITLESIYTLVFTTNMNVLISLYHKNESEVGQNIQYHGLAYLNKTRSCDFIQKHSIHVHRNFCLVHGNIGFLTKIVEHYCNMGPTIHTIHNTQNRDCLLRFKHLENKIGTIVMLSAIYNVETATSNQKRRRCTFACS